MGAASVRLRSPKRPPYLRTECDISILPYPVTFLLCSDTAFSQGSEIGADELVFTKMSLHRPSGTRAAELQVVRPFVPSRRESDVSTDGSELDRIPVQWKEDSPSPVVINSSSPTNPMPSTRLPPEKTFTLAGKSLDAIEREAIQQTLSVCNGNKAKAARMLEISEKSIYNKMRRLNVEWPPSSGSHGS